MMTCTSEYCAVGHPDRTCDYVASHILDQHLAADPLSRVALEVQLKDRFCTVSGEVSSKAGFTDAEIAEMCREAVRRVGYTDEYVRRFGEGNAVSGSSLEVTTHLSRQSPDIALGVDRDGWGDQGIFWGYAVDAPDRGNMPKDHWLARGIANAVCRSGWGGIDVKTQVTVEDGLPTECVVAVPVLPDDAASVASLVERSVRAVTWPGCEVVVNGTGRYVTHGPAADCGTTGRKLVADFYGGNSRIGGGSPWGKDPSKADVALNVLARRKALDYMAAHRLDEVRCAISCCIGRSEIRVAYFDGEGRQLWAMVEDAPPSKVVEHLGLRVPHYAMRCAEGLFGFE